MEWQVFPEVGPLLPEEEEEEEEEEGAIDGYITITGEVVNGFVCWVHTEKGCILSLNTATFQFSRMDLPLPLIGPRPYRNFKLGQTNAGKLCIVSAHGLKLYLWLQTADDDGVNKFMLHKVFPLHASVKKVTDLEEDEDAMQLQAEPMAVVDGFVYLSVSVGNYWELHSPQWFLTFCLETAEDPESGVTGENSEDDGAMCTEAASPVLFTALQSFREALIDDDRRDRDDFLLDDENNSLLNRIANLETGFATLRDCVLRIVLAPSTGKGWKRQLVANVEGKAEKSVLPIPFVDLAFLPRKNDEHFLKHAASEG